jgi:hypothetical protein
MPFSYWLEVSVTIELPGSKNKCPNVRQLNIYIQKIRTDKHTYIKSYLLQMGCRAGGFTYQKHALRLKTSSPVSMKQLYEVPQEQV